MTWTTPDEPNGIILYYTVYCNEDQGYHGGSGILPPDVVTMVSGIQNFAVVTSLTPFTLYNCYVTATTSAGEGNTSIVVAAQTDESGKSQHFRHNTFINLSLLYMQNLEMHLLTLLQL